VQCCLDSPCLDAFKFKLICCGFGTPALIERFSVTTACRLHTVPSHDALPECWRHRALHLSTQLRTDGGGGLQAGYPYACYEVTTKDGYVLQLQRLPRQRCRDAVFYVHGVMDTALAWVGTSVTEALAFSSWEAGYDVWLASCRSNPPRTHTQKSYRGAKYFSYTVNELACLDLSAQVRCFVLPICFYNVMRSSLNPES
jgi:hypothetical protein